jgi:hypothetical protein
MATKHNKQIKKLSTAIKRGKQIADERGIKQTRGGFWLKPNKGGTKIECACALGMALIGKLGVEACTEVATKGGISIAGLVEEAFPESGVPNCCLSKAVYEKRKNLPTASYYGVDSLIITMNDSTRMPIEEIVEILESCNL